MVEALRLAEADTGRFPSYRQYEAWRSRQPSPQEWPSGSSIGRAWGSWSRMLDALAVEPCARPQTVGMRALGAAISRKEMLAAIREFADDVEERPLTLASYERWARQTKDRDGHARVPLSVTPFRRVFGGFAEAVEAAGLPARWHSMGLGTRGWYSGEEMISAVQGASRDLGKAVPTTSEYRSWRRALLVDSRKRGSRLALPSDEAIVARLQTWADALGAAGLLAEDEVALLRGSGRALEVSRVAKVLLEVVGELGPEVTRTEYGRWRATRPRVHGRVEAPDHWGLVRRFGRWSTLISTVAGSIDARDPQVELERRLCEMSSH